jgi:glutamate 5-kinase
MVTKIDAARRAALSGAHTIIASGRTKGVLGLLLADKKIGTFLQSRELKIVARKKWLADNSTSTGKIFVDTGAANALIKDGKSLLSVGIVKIEGVFDRGAIVACIDSSGNIIAQGLVNYSSEEAKKIIGVSSDKIINKLGYVYELNFIHRNNLVITSNVRKIND